MIRFGLCCIFLEEPIKFRTTTATVLLAMPRRDRLRKVSEICLHNARNLMAAVETAHRLGIDGFRVLSGLMPRATHPKAGYALDELPDADEIARLYRRVNRFRREHGMRLTFHPDQFVLLNSIDDDVNRRSITELEMHAFQSSMAGADVINIHAGGVYGDKAASLDRLAANLGRLSAQARRRLTLENDDSQYTPRDLLPFCARHKVPLVYDVHHHRCNPDGMSVGDATLAAMATWRGREPVLHISSPKNGWSSANSKPHADYVDPEDIPAEWLNLDGVTIEVEAKAKEKAVVKFIADWASSASA